MNILLNYMGEDLLWEDYVSSDEEREGLEDEEDDDI
jgi:hypothetical protein